MQREQVTAQSPLRILEASIHGGLGAGKLGVFLARAGVGKTAMLVRVGLDDALRDRDVLHVALGRSLDDTVRWYEALFDDLVRRTQLADPLAARATLGRRRTIQSFPDGVLSAERLRRVIQLYSEHLSLDPAVILIDDYAWDDTPNALAALKAVGAEVGAEVWMTAQTHRERPAPAGTIPLPCAPFAELIDVALCLSPDGANVRIGLLKDHENQTPAETPLTFDPYTMRLLPHQREGAPPDPKRVTLLSGGAEGAEAAFGEVAERWGVKEKNFTFAGREPHRRVSIVELGRDALKLGGVSTAYIEAHLGRRFPATPEFQKLLQSIWHQVVTAEQVFVVGAVLDDDTVKGGTGWAAELAKKLHKPLFVFDQGREAWRVWGGDGWREVDPPRIEAEQICGTGTQNLTEAGRAAIEALFSRSFG